MTRRRNSINIYDYPEHLNPFREDVDDDSEKFNTTGRRRSSFRENAWAMFSGHKAGERSTEDEVKYLQQGAKPKKKRRAPLPPGPPPSKSPGDTRQVNSNESEASLTSSITSSSAEEPTSHEQSVSTSPDLKVIVHEPEIYPEKENPESKFPVNEEVPENTEVSVSKDSPLDQQNELLEETSKLENNISVSQECINSNKDETDAEEKFENQTDKDKNITEVQNDEKGEKPANGIDHKKGSLENLKVNFDVILHISEEDLRDKDPPVQNGNHSKSDVNHNVEHINGNGVTKTDDSVKVEDKENEVKLQNGENDLNESNLSESEMKLNMVNKTQQSPSKTPEPKPRTILPLSKDI